MVTKLWPGVLKHQLQRVNVTKYFVPNSEPWKYVQKDTTSVIINIIDMIGERWKVNWRVNPNYWEELYKQWKVDVIVAME